MQQQYEQFDVFISYNRHIKKELVFRIANDLSVKHNIKYWIDEEQLKYDDNLYERVHAAIKFSSVVLCFITKEYDESEFCRRELVIASKYEKPVILLLLNEYESLNYVRLLISTRYKINAYQDMHKFSKCDGYAYKDMIETLYKLLDRPLDSTENDEFRYSRNSEIENETVRNANVANAEAGGTGVYKKAKKMPNRCSLPSNILSIFNRGHTISNCKNIILLNVSNAKTFIKDFAESHLHPTLLKPYKSSNGSTLGKTSSKKKQTTYVDSETIDPTVKQPKDIKTYKIVDIGNINPNSMCYLRNSTLLVADEKSGLYLFDKNFKQIQHITNINDFYFKPKSLATNKRGNKIFISDTENNCVIKTNSEFNQITVFGDQKGSLDDQLDCPHGICYYDKSVFVCDSDNKRIQMLKSSGLKFIKSQKLSYRPYEIQVLSGCVFIKTLHDIYFYKYPSFVVISVYYRQYPWIIGKIDSIFCEYFRGKLYCYDQNGTLTNKLDLGEFDGFFNGIDCNNTIGSITHFNNKIALCWSFRNKLILADI